MKKARNFSFSSSDSELANMFKVEKESCTNRNKNRHTCLPNERLLSRSLATKRRRWISEKRRRDRMNNSLSELRRLAETAYFMAHLMAVQYRNQGFRECLAEVAHYLSLAEDRVSSDLLQDHLMSHLGTCASQREVHYDRGHATPGCASQREVHYDRGHATPGCASQREVHYDRGHATPGCGFSNPFPAHQPHQPFHFAPAQAQLSVSSVAPQSSGSSPAPSSASSSSSRSPAYLSVSTQLPPHRQPLVAPGLSSMPLCGPHTSSSVPVATPPL